MHSETGVYVLRYSHSKWVSQRSARSPFAFLRMEATATIGTEPVAFSSCRYRFAYFRGSQAVGDPPLRVAAVLGLGAVGGEERIVTTDGQT